jgi:hypothetical protein
LALFGRRPAQSAERLVVAGVQKPAQYQTSRQGWQCREQYRSARLSV